MKKVGIMTWYQHKNYGTYLQAAALIDVVSKMGYDPSGIDYVSYGYNRMTTLEKLLSFDRTWSGIKHRINERRYTKRTDTEKEKSFEDFKLSFFHMSNPVQTASQLFSLNDEYDAFIAGSDQIWTPNAYNSKYYLDFVSDNQKKIAYAPSFGVNDIDNPYVKQEIGRQLKTFPFLSVREKQASELISKYYNISASVVLDPTLLLSNEDWNKFIKTNGYRADILVYFLGENESYWKAIESIARQTGLSVSIIPVHRKDFERKYNVLYGIGPSEFLSVLRNAKMICTDSFHGMVFSILFHKYFVAFRRFSDSNKASQNSRVYNLLDMLGLKKQLWNGKYIKNTIDWNLVDVRLNDRRKESMEFLSNALRTATAKKKEFPGITNTCCGCGVCEKICPHHAISMVLEGGFYKAQVSKDKCIECGLCKKICAFASVNGKELSEGKLFEARSTNEADMSRSTSGAISHEILSYSVNNKFPVYGCEFDYHSGTVKHTISLNEYGIQRFRGSKYLQSKFFSDLSILDKDNGVIVGTPCQIASVDNYLRLKNKREHFLLIDLICHGVPTQGLWTSWLKYMNIDPKGLKEIRFRDSERGWKKIYIYADFNGKRISEKEENNLFYTFFDLQSCYMPSCYECNYRTKSHADIRLGDYWGKQFSSTDMRLGVSMVVAFTDKGERILNQLAENEKIKMEERDIGDYYKGQGPVNPIIPLYYRELINDLNNTDNDLHALLMTHCKMQYYNRKMQLLKSKIKRICGKSNGKE